VKAVSGRELVKLAERKGWTLLRIAGSHHIYGKPGSAVRLTVPIHGSRALKIGLQRHLMKLAGIAESEL
jgi:predicted RNA binding protein YcfA (HicA-like mRNA interferase family)